MASRTLDSPPHVVPMDSFKHLKDRARSLLPARLFLNTKHTHQKPLFLSFALQRSGQHLIIDWICRGLSGNTIHFNHCRFIRKGLANRLYPMTGRRVVYAKESIDDSGQQGLDALVQELPYPPMSNYLFSIEDARIAEPRITRLIAEVRPRILIILRDPANWLASSLKHDRHDHEQLRRNLLTKIEYLRIATGKQSLTNSLVINYNAFIVDAEYRRELGEQFGGFNFAAAERAINLVPDFGGGSSFRSSNMNSGSTLDRWREYESDPLFWETLESRELLSLSKAFFGNAPALAKLSEFLRHSQ